MATDPRAPARRPADDERSSRRALLLGLLRAASAPRTIADLAEEMGALLDYLGDTEQAVVMGDFNSLALQRPRRMLAQQSFKSVFTLTAGRRPPTIPTPDYEFMLSPKEQRWLKLVRPLLSIDDIYVKNLGVVEAGTLVGESDHVLLHATLEQ